MQMDSNIQKNTHSEHCQLTKTVKQTGRRIFFHSAGCVCGNPVPSYSVIQFIFTSFQCTVITFFGTKIVSVEMNIRDEDEGIIGFGYANQ